MFIGTCPRSTLIISSAAVMPIRYMASSVTAAVCGVMSTFSKPTGITGFRRFILEDVECGSSEMMAR